MVTLTNEKSKLQAELLPIQSEAASFRFRFTEAEKVTLPCAVLIRVYVSFRELYCLLERFAVAQSSAVRVGILFSPRFRITY